MRKQLPGHLQVLMVLRTPRDRREADEVDALHLLRLVSRLQTTCRSSMTIKTRRHLALTNS